MRNASAESFDSSFAQARQDSQSIFVVLPREREKPGAIGVDKFSIIIN